MQIDLVTTAITCGALAFGCWMMAARNKRPDARSNPQASKPGVYLRSGNFTLWGNIWRWGYIIFNALAVLAAGALLVLNVT